MNLITDIISPAELTGYVRSAAEEAEADKQSLAAFLPNRAVSDIAVQLMVGEHGLSEMANYRAFDAEADPLAAPSDQAVTFDLHALGGWLPVSEYNQLRARNAQVSDAQAVGLIQRAAKIGVQAVYDRVEAMRGHILETGKATVSTGKFKFDNDFGRSADMNVTAATLWTAAGADPLADLVAWADEYADRNGERPGAIVVSSNVAKLIRKADNLKTILAGGGERPATLAQVNEFLNDEGLPYLTVYDRKVRGRDGLQRVLSDKSVLLLPAAGPTDNDAGTALGSTVWGQTLSATQDDWAIEDVERPGIVTGAYRNPTPPHGIQVYVDAIAEPFLANADLSMVATVSA